MATEQERKAKYDASEKGRERHRRYNASAKGQARYARHEAVKGYVRKRIRKLEAERERVRAALEDNRREQECQTSC